MFRLLMAGVLTAALAAGAGGKAKKDDSAPITRQQADAILDELRQIHDLLRKMAAEPRAAAPAAAPEQKAQLSLGSDPTLGSKDAPVTIVEFADYQCPFCRFFQMNTFEDLRKKYIDTGKVRFVSRDLPLEMHNNAARAAEAARCAGDQGQFWKMRETLVTNASKLAAEDIRGYAQSLGLNAGAFDACLDSGKYRQVIQDDVKQAFALNITGTPSFVIGKTTADGVDGIVLVGAQPLAAFEAKISQYQGRP